MIPFTGKLIALAALGTLLSLQLNATTFSDDFTTDPFAGSDWFRSSDSVVQYDSVNDRVTFNTTGHINRTASAGAVTDGETALATGLFTAEGNFTQLTFGFTDAPNTTNSYPTLNNYLILRVRNAGAGSTTVVDYEYRQGAAPAQAVTLASGLDVANDDPISFSIERSGDDYSISISGSSIGGTYADTVNLPFLSLQNNYYWFEQRGSGATALTNAAVIPENANIGLMLSVAILGLLTLRKRFRSV